MLNALYPFVLAFHNFWRWIALAAVLAALILSLPGWFARKPWTLSNERVARAAVGIMDVQLLLGLILYLGLSPLSRTLWLHFDAAMQSRDTRFFGLEHPFLMILATAAVHAGKLRSSRAAADGPKHRAIVLWFGGSLILMLLGTPWWRPLLRGL